MVWFILERGSGIFHSFWANLINHKTSFKIGTSKLMVSQAGIVSSRGSGLSHVIHKTLGKKTIKSESYLYSIYIYICIETNIVAGWKQQQGQKVHDFTSISLDSIKIFVISYHYYVTSYHILSYIIYLKNTIIINDNIQKNCSSRCYTVFSSFHPVTIRIRL